MRILISYLAVVLSFIFSSCAYDLINTFAKSVSTSECRDKLHVPNYHWKWSTLDMNISGSKANCQLRNIGVPAGFNEVIVKVSSSQHLVKVILEYNYTIYVDCGDCFHHVYFTLDDLPEEKFVFEVYSVYNHKDPAYSYSWKYSNPHIRTMIYMNNPENSHLEIPFERNPD